MTTERQIEANRQNAQRSTGPLTEAGKAASRKNATKHGLASCSTVVEADLAGAFDDRRDAWGREMKPQTEQAESALDRAVASSLRIEQCERAFNALSLAQSTRARLAWDDDRTIEAATLLGRLSKAPVLVAAQLASTRHGAELLIETWNRLGEALSANGDWSESERSAALDLLGVPADLREGRTALTPPPGHEPADWLRAVAVGERDRLARKKEESLDEIDASDRSLAEMGAMVVLTKPAGLLLRYERDAWRRFRESLKEAMAPAVEAPPTVVEAPASVDLAPPAPVEPPELPVARPEPPLSVSPPPLIPAVQTAIEGQHPAKGLNLKTIAPLNRHERRAQAAMSRSS